MLVARIVSLVLGPGGRVFLVAFAFIAWTVYQRIDATSDYKKAQVHIDLEETNRKLEEAAAISQKAQLRVEQVVKELQQAEREKNAILSEIQASGGSCPLSDSVRKRLRDIK